MHFVNWLTSKLPQHNILTTVKLSSMCVTFAITSYLCLCFIKVIVLVPWIVCFSTTATYLSSCFFHVFLCSLLLPCILKVYCIKCGIEDLMTGVDNLQQAISHGTQKLHVSHIDFVMTHREGIWAWIVWKCAYVVEILNYLKPFSQCTVSKRLPIPALYNIH